MGGVRMWFWSGEKASNAWEEELNVSVRGQFISARRTDSCSGREGSKRGGGDENESSLFEPSTGEEVA